MAGPVKDSSSLKSKEDEIRSLSSKIQQTAHDLNNIITSSQNSVVAIKNSAKPNAEIQKYLTNIETNCIRATEMLEEFLASEGIGKRTKRRINLNDLINDVVRTLKGTLSEKVSLDIKVRKNLLKIEGFYSDLYRAILNLSINAFEAIEDKGKITLSAKNKNSKLSGGVVEVLIKDTGCGIDKNTLKSIFKNGFSTKNKNVTSGLGLSIVKEIIEIHKGTIEVKSNVGKGTEFAILLPAIETIKKPKKKNRIKNILVAEDEPPILESLTYLLESYNYKTIGASSGKIAIEKFMENKDIDLILIDKLMPDIDGIDVVAKIREHNKSIPIILTTGIQNADQLKLEDIGVNIVVKKPYDFDQMIELIRGGIF